MILSQLDRVNIVMLAKTIYTSSSLLQATEDINTYLKRLNRYQLFTVGELAELSNCTPYKVRQALDGDKELRARSGIKPRHLDHIIRMIGSDDFTKKHIKSLIKDGATFASLSRVIGIPESNLRRWERGKAK